MVVALLAGLASMALSYTTVRYITRDRPPPMQQPAPAPAQQETSPLRVWCNEVVHLTNDYSTYLPLDASSPRPTARRWIDHHYRPRLRTLYEAMTQQSAGASPAHRALMAATDRLMTMARRPADRALRRRATQELQRATRTVDTEIAAGRAKTTQRTLPTKPNS